MSYRIKAGQPVPKNMRRIVSEEIDHALKLLTRRASLHRDESIHEARKSVKKIRGVLKLMRPQLGDAYSSENIALREIGRQLSQLRDAGAVIETLDNIAESYQGEMRPNAFAAIRKGLEKDKRERERALDVTATMNRAASGLRACKRRLARWPLSADGFSAIAPGLRSTYRAGRKAMAKALKTDRPESFHDWRKRAKDHWYHVRLLEDLWAGVMDARENELHQLETWLGDDHNLAVLQQLLEADPGRYGGEEPVRLFAALAVDRQKELRARSQAVGRRLYELKPKQLLRELKHLWELWQAEPKPVRAQRTRPARRGSEEGVPDLGGAH